MNNTDFTDFLRQIITDIADTLDSKADFYASEFDRLHNFKAAAKRDNISPQMALRGMQLKHRQAIADYLEYPSLTYVPYDEWKEKIIDTINYYLLLLAMIHEKQLREGQKDG